MQTYAGRIIDDLVHQGQSTKPLEIGIQAVVNPDWIAVRIKKLVRVGQAQGIILQALDLIQHTRVTAYTQTTHHIIGSFKAKPVNASDAYWTILLIQKLRALSVPVALPDRCCILLR